MQPNQMSGIKLQAVKLKNDIRVQKRGFERRLTEFVREYSADPAIERRAIILGHKVSSAYGTASLINEITEDLLEVVDQVLEDDSPLTQLRTRQIKSEINLIETYIKKKQVVFKCSDLTKSFASDFKLYPMSLEIRRGDITAVVGENGNGKTTFFRMIAGELMPDGGNLSYPFLHQGTEAGADINWVKVKKRIAYVPQELPRWRDNLQANLHYEAAIHGILGKENQKEVEFVIDRLDLREHLSKRWKELSGGYKFRFALARALVWKPDLMILDEPLANLDVNAQMNVLRDIKSLATSISNPIAVFISSQHLHEVESIADNLLFLKQGRPIYNGRLNHLGASRTENIFEVGSSLPFNEFCQLFPESIPLSFSNTGLYYIITADLEVSADQILQILIHANAAPEYFRNISRSSKSLFTKYAA